MVFLERSHGILSIYGSCCNSQLEVTLSSLASSEKRANLLLANVKYAAARPVA